MFSESDSTPRVQEDASLHTPMNPASTPGRLLEIAAQVSPIATDFRHYALVR